MVIDIIGGGYDGNNKAVHTSSGGLLGWLEVNIERLCIAGDRRWRHECLLVIAIHR